MKTIPRMRLLSGGFLALVLFVLSPLRGSAQQTLGSLNGTVLDPSGASVPDATVTVTNAQIDLVRSTKSQSNGFFQIFNLPIGTYKVTVSREGFETTDQSGVSVQEARATTVNVSMKLGQASETVEVVGNPLLNATDATNGYTLDSAQIDETPLATGSFTQLAVLSPGVNAELLSGIGTNAGLGNQPVWANGQRDTSNTFQVDGVDVTNLFNGKSSSQDASQRYNFNIGQGSSTAGAIQNGTSVYGSNGNGMPTPPQDFLQELRVNSSMYDAQQGATSGAQIDANTRTGSNKWHGAAFGTRANNIMNAAPYFFKQANIESPSSFLSSYVNPQFHRDTLGATVGGPLWKDKLYFFAGYQNLHTSDQSQGLSQLTVPYGLTDDRSGAGILAALNSYYAASKKSTVTSYTVDPIASALLNAKLPNGKYLIPSVQDASPSLVTSNQPNVTLLGTTYFNANQATGALDYNATKSDRVSLKYYYQHDPYSSPYNVSNTGGFPENEDSGSQVAAIGNTISIGPRINWEQRLGFVRVKVYSNFKQEVVDGTGGPTFGIAFPNAIGLPGMTLAKFASGSGNSVTAGPASAFVDDGYFQNRLNPSTNVIFALGKHTIVAGGGDSYTQLNIRNLRTGIGSLKTKDFPNFLSGNVQTSNVLNSISAQGKNLANRYYRSNEVSGYIQDKYQAMSNLSITAGVRYDYHGAFTEKYGNIFNFEPKLYNVTGTTVTDGNSATGTTTGFTVNNAGFIVAGNNKYYPTKGVSDSTQTGRQWGISPRVGFAWAPKMNGGRVVFSGGAGLYYDRGELFSYLSQPAGGGIGGPFGATEAPPLNSAPQGSGTLANPLGSTVVPVPNADPSFFTAELQSNLATMLSVCTGVVNQSDYTLCNASLLQSFGAYARDNKLPYTTNFNFKMQWQPVNDVAFTIGYTGNRGFHGVLPIPFNQPGIATTSSPINGEQYSYGYEVLNSASPADAYGDLNPISTEPYDTPDGGNDDFRSPYIGYSPSAALFKASGTSAYDALETHIEKRFSHHFQLGASYTFSHARDEQSDIGLFFTGNDPNHIRNSYASADFDRTNVFSANFVAAVPNLVKSHNALRYLTNDWTLGGIVIAQNGEPYSLYEFYGAVASIYYGNFPNLLNPVLGIKDPKNPRSALTGNKGAQRGPGGSYFPAVDLSQVAINYITPGNKGVPACNTTEPCDIFENDYAPGNQRNIFRQSPQKRADVSLRKQFHFTERFSAQYEFNVFNLTNTTSLDIPQDSITIGQAYTCDPSLPCGNGIYPNYGQVVPLKGQEQNILQSSDPSTNPLYLLPQTSGTGKALTSNKNYGSVTGTIGSARIITMGIHINY